MARSGRVLFVDAFDSFSNNIIALLESRCAVTTIKLTILADVKTLEQAITSVQAVVIGPGPGIATESNDIGNIDAVWSLCQEHSVPVLGICLGFQTLVLRYGGTSGRLKRPRHGLPTRITSCGSGPLFSQLDQIQSVQYHSNFVSIGHSMESGGLGVAEHGRYAWEPSLQCPDLVPLAWDLDRRTEIDAYLPIFPDACDSHNPSAILMSVQHRTLPFFGLQFHPESVRSSEQARRVVLNWWDFARTYQTNPKNGVTEVEIPQLVQVPASIEKFLESSPSHESVKRFPLLFEQLDCNLSVLSVIKTLELSPERGQDLVLLDSEKCLRPELGVSSIIGLMQPNTPRIKYKVGEDTVQLFEEGTTKDIKLESSSRAIFSFLKSYMSGKMVKKNSGPASSSFWGGLVGYISYEAGLEALGVPLEDGQNDDNVPPDINFAFIERSIVINHEEQKTFIQSANENDRDWLNKTSLLLQKMKLDLKTDPQDGPAHGSGTSQNLNNGTQQQQRQTRSGPPVQEQETPFQQEDRVGYTNKIRDCLEYINNGDSYELCLTGKTRLPTSDTSIGADWALYRRLRNNNPAPFGAYLKLDSTTVASSSPERFLSWTRPGSSVDKSDTHDAQDLFKCQFRPIKGTVKKQHVDCSGQISIVDRSTAEKILSTAKEEAENLMIADLIRHDLAGIIGSTNVYTKDLMRIEEYETVYQLVTVIEGRIPPSQLPRHGSTKQIERTNGYRPDIGTVQGIDILGATLPPGSMTGAPKKRSCEILRKIEGGRKRSVYAGVLGYLDVGGAGDFSVVIRTAYKCSADEPGRTAGEWNIGAGGAITALSSLDGEWDEMRAKLESVLPAFHNQ